MIRPSGLGPLLVIWISHVRCPAPKTLVVIKTASMKLPVKSLEPREEVKVPVAEATRGAVGTLSPRGQAALNPQALACLRVQPVPRQAHRGQARWLSEASSSYSLGIPPAIRDSSDTYVDAAVRLRACVRTRQLRNRRKRGSIRRCSARRWHFRCLSPNVGGFGKPGLGQLTKDYRIPSRCTSAGQEMQDRQKTSRLTRPRADRHPKPANSHALGLIDKRSGRLSRHSADQQNLSVMSRNSVDRRKSGAFWNARTASARSL